MCVEAFGDTKEKTYGDAGLTRKEIYNTVIGILLNHYPSFDEMVENAPLAIKKADQIFDFLYRSGVIE